MRREPRLGGWLAAAALFALASACDQRSRTPAVSAGSGTTASASGAGGSGGSGIIIEIPPLPEPVACGVELDTPLQRVPVLDLDNTLDALFPPGPHLADAKTDGLTVLFARALREVAEARAEAVTIDADALAACAEGTNQKTSCLQQWLGDWGRKLYRRPLSAEQLTAYTIQFQSVARASSVVEAARNALVSLILSPYFVLRIELGDDHGGGHRWLSQYERAARLSHFATRRAPDELLLDAAAQEHLNTHGQLLEQLHRLWALPEGRRARPLLYLEWLGMDRPSERQDLDPELRAGMDEQARSFISGVLDDGGGTILGLLTSEHRLSQRLALHYGITTASSSEQTPVDSSRTPYAGLLATGAFLTRYPRPTLRGARILDAFSCAQTGPHPEAVGITLAEGPTPRERITRSVAGSPACTSCHQLVDPPGFALEAFDDQGRLTSFDTTGALTNLLKPAIPVDGPRALGAAIAQAHSAERCFAQRYFEALTGRPISSGIQAKVVDFPRTPEEEWLDCVEQRLYSNSLTQVEEMVAIGSLTLEMPSETNAVIAFDTSPGATQHAYQETLQFHNAFPNDTNMLVLSYQNALEQLQQLDQMLAAQTGEGGSGGAP